MRSLNQEDARLYAAQWVLLSRTEPGRAEALDEIRRLASDGHYDAIAMMGDVYALGRDVPQDLNETAIWWRRAAAPEAPDHVLRAMAEMFLQYRAKPIHNPRLAAKIMDRLMRTRRSVRDNSAYLELWSRAHQSTGNRRRAADIRWQAFAADLGIPI